MPPVPGSGGAGRNIHHFGDAFGARTLLAGRMEARGELDRAVTRAFVALFLGWPLWWVLGVGAIAPLAVAALAALALLRRREPLHLPPGTSVWLLFLVWVGAGVFLLGVDAPGAAPGGDGGGRLMVFGYRAAWYLACTVLLVWLTNVKRHDLPDQKVRAVLAWVFAITTVGGVLGLVLPHLEFTSALEAVLPGGLRSNSFVSSLVHPQTADVQMVLGRPEARPKAPFAFTNTWGSVLALSAVFAVTWAVLGGLRARVVLIVLLGVGAIPAVFSLNRGLWACVVLGVIGVVALELRNRRAGRLALGAGVLVAVLVLAAGPLVSLVNERLDNQHSNERRGQLASATVDSVTSGSPVVGFGTTRDVQGSFASISGGSTPDCPACGVPPMGTQGHFWLVLFSQGWIGVALFLAFLAIALTRTWRCSSANETVATFCLVFFALQIFIYDTLGLPLLLVFVALALVWREQRETGRETRAWTTPQLAERMRRGAPVALGLTVLGAGAGLTSTLVDHTSSWATQVRVVLTSPPDPYSPAVLGGVLGYGTRTARSTDITIDTEAALLLSEQTLDNALARIHAAPDAGPDTGVTPAELRDGVRISAEPNSHILVLDVTGPSPTAANERGSSIATTYLAARQEYVDERRTDVLARLNQDLRNVVPDNPRTAALMLRLNAADRMLRSDTGGVGRVVNVAPARAVPRRTAMRTTSGGALGFLVGVGAAALTAARPRRPRRTRHAHVARTTSGRTS